MEGSSLISDTLMKLFFNTFCTVSYYHRLLCIGSGYSWHQSIYRRWRHSNIQFLWRCFWVFHTCSHLSSPVIIVLSDVRLLFYPVIACSPSHPPRLWGLFMLGLAAHTSFLTLRLRCTPHPAASGHTEKPCKQEVKTTLCQEGVWIKVNVIIS